MAKEKENPYAGKSAGDVLAGTATAGDDRTPIDGIGTNDPYEGYAEALKNYEARPDAETLEDRRARDGGLAGEGREVVEAEQEQDGGVVTAPKAKPKA